MTSCCTCCDSPGYQTSSRSAILGVSLVSLIFSIVTVLDCTFWKIEDFIPFDDDEDTYLDISAGLFSWKHPLTGDCESYDDLGQVLVDEYGDYLPDAYKDEEFITAGHNTGKAFGILTALAVGFAMLGTASIVFFVSKDMGAKWFWLATRVLFVLAVIFAPITFVFTDRCKDFEELQELWEGEEECKLGTAGVLNAVNVLILLAIAIAAWFTLIPEDPILKACGGGVEPKPKDHHGEDEMKEQAPPKGSTMIKKTIENTPEGRKVIEEVAFPDGSKKITETFERF